MVTHVRREDVLRTAASYAVTESEVTDYGVTPQHLLWRLEKIPPSEICSVFFFFFF